jgi:thiamine kinase-like enzyme
MDRIHGVPSIETHFDLSDPKNSATKILRALQLQPDQTSVSDMQPVTGGSTNTLFRCVLRSDSPEDKEEAILFRIFGGEGSIDRAKDNEIFTSLATSGLGPRCFGLFANGRVEEFLAGFRSLTYKELSDEAVASAIATQMARVHNFQPPAQVVGPERKPCMWDQLWGWHQQALGVQFQAGTREAALLETLNLAGAERELRQLQARVDDSWPLAFCHNDLNAENVMLNPDSGKIYLIDFEYGGMNYLAFDIANHFNEYAGVRENPDYSNFPSDSKMKSFIATYIAEATRLVSQGTEIDTQGGGEDVNFEQHEDKRAHSNCDTIDHESTRRPSSRQQGTNEEPLHDKHTKADMHEQDLDQSVHSPWTLTFENLMEQIRVFVLIDHWYWVLWAVNMAATKEPLRLFFLEYSSNRIKEFWRRKAILRL